jgi:hypothetical protein
VSSRVWIYWTSLLFVSMGSWGMMYSMGGGRRCVVPHGAREGIRHEFHQEFIYWTSLLFVSMGSWEMRYSMGGGKRCVVPHGAREGTRHKFH